MDALDDVRLGMSAEKTVTVTSDMPVGHYRGRHAAGLCHVHDDPAYGNGIGRRHRFASPVGLCQRRYGRESPSPRGNARGRTVRAISRVIQIDSKSVVFEVEAWDGHRKIGDGTHRRGVVNMLEFEKRFGLRPLAMASD